MKDWRHLVEPEKKGFPWWRLGLLVFACGALALCFTPFPGKVKRTIEGWLKPQVVEVPADETDIRRQIEARVRSEMEMDLERQLAAIQRRADARVSEIEDAYRSKPESLSLPLGKITDVRKLRSGIPFVSEMDFQQGGLASVERVDEASYAAKYQLRVRMPAAATTLKELETTNPLLSKMLPGLSTHLEGAKVSGWFNRLYENKAERIQKQAHTLNELLTKHNLYDCETMLEFEGLKGRKVFLMQAEMDVVSDGSDGDRLPEMPDSIVSSTNYQPFTSYGWVKQTRTPNPMIDGWVKRMAVGRKELENPATSGERKAWLKSRLDYLKRGIADMKSRSFLIAEYDPFIVISVDMLTSIKSYAPKVGDYAVVVYGNKLYPVIVGDGGPTFKVGEASLRMARELNPKATPYSRPVSDLKVTYIVFPNSRDAKKAPPDYVKWRERCGELLNEIGGLGEGYELHQWKDLLAKPVPPTPAPVETPDPQKTPASDEPAPAAAPSAPVPAEPEKSE